MTVDSQLLIKVKSLSKMEKVQLKWKKSVQSGE